MKTVKLILRMVLGLIGGVYLVVAAVMYKLMQETPLPDEDIPVLFAVFGGLGGLFLGLAVLIPWLVGRGERRRQELLAWGQRVTATVVDVRPNYNVRVNRRHPWVVYAECIHPVTREKVVLHSHSVWNCHIATGQSVDVVFDQMNEKRFAFDIPEGEVGA